MEKGTTISTNNNALVVPKNKRATLAQNVLKDVQINGGYSPSTKPSRLAVLKDLGNQLQIKAERMRLLARAEQGLEDNDLNPYVTQTIVPSVPADKDFRWV